ncbi:MAG TPA: hypothetical protein VNB29_07060 [Chthoniobacterales bacterium]|nr:hypothetical protein [Chthoniobacterales bacterium]
MNRVPQIVFIYWVIKIASTTLGETGADMVSMTFNLGYAATLLIFLAAFAVLLGFKLAIRRYEPVLYWLVFTASAIAGTAISDFIDRTLGLGYAAGAGILVGLLLIVLAIWKAKEKTISVENITTAPAEWLYWIAFLIANTLGTAAGDYLADDAGLGFLTSAGLISAILILVAVLHFTTRLSPVGLFWVAFVLTRPFGATFGDFLTKPLSHGGLNLGTIGASIFFAVVLALAIWKEARLERARRIPVVG